MNDILGRRGRIEHLLLNFPILAHELAPLDDHEIERLFDAVHQPPEGDRKALALVQGLEVRLERFTIFSDTMKRLRLFVLAIIEEDHLESLLTLWQAPNSGYTFVRLARNFLNGFNVDGLAQLDVPTQCNLVVMLDADNEETLKEWFLYNIRMRKGIIGMMAFLLKDGYEEPEVFVMPIEFNAD